MNIWKGVIFYGIVLYWVMGFLVWKKIDYDTLDVGQVEIRKPSYKTHLCSVTFKDVFMSCVIVPFLLGAVLFMLGCFIKQEIRFKIQKQRWKPKG